MGHNEGKGDKRMNNDAAGKALAVLLSLVIFGVILIVIFVLPAIKSLPGYEHYRLPVGTEVDGWKIGACYRWKDRDPFSTTDNVMRIVDYKDGYIQYRYFWSHLNGWLDYSSFASSIHIIYEDFPSPCPTTIWEDKFGIGKGDRYDATQ